MPERTADTAPNPQKSSVPCDDPSFASLPWRTHVSGGLMTACGVDTGASVQQELRPEAYGLDLGQEVKAAFNGSSVALFAHLPAMTQEVIGQHAGHHGLADRHGADADTGIVTALGEDICLAAV